MSNLKQELELLYQLQCYDIKIDSYNKKIDNKLTSIKEKKITVNNELLNLNIKRKFIGHLILKKNVKESELSNIENIINKYLTELNNVKSNAMYKTLLIEIDKLKLKKNFIENEVIELIYKIDDNNETLMNCEAKYKQYVKNIYSEINNMTLVINKLKQELKILYDTKEKIRLQIKKELLIQYDKLYNNNYNNCICHIKENSCSGCGFILRPQLINQVNKYKELIFCDNCSRILIK
ncbi:MAG: C4-type zinc ribbon domain-containing protein [Endomicrobium sp.]|jgi:predicted  nucleic acid-binding Zn-ribbon protein|nr:C4-type zinc ribbon domain-containing protein [Endomicrobium sp.]